MHEDRTEVVIVGGGATGVGVLRDLSMRGIKTVLYEQGDLAHGTSSRFHGLLHSGARYAVTDPVSALECIRENNTLKKIAPHCIADCGGWFVQLDQDEPNYLQEWLAKCQELGISVKEVPLARALQEEPSLSKNVVKVFEVPDAVVDGFKLVWANAKTAKDFGGEYYTYHRVDSLLREGNKVTGITGTALRNNEKFTAYASLVINASGAWGPQLLDTAGISLEVLSDKGTLLAFNQRLFKHVINRLRLPDDGDIFVPHETITIMGTTSQLVNKPGENRPEVSEVKSLLKAGAEILPGIESKRIIRSFAGVRPLYQGQKESGSKDMNRQVSRNFALIDHESADGISGLLSIVGGKFTTYRLMAEKAADWAAGKLGNQKACQTAEVSLSVGFSPQLLQEASKSLPWGVAVKMLERLEAEAEAVVKTIKEDPRQGQMLCECEMVSVAEVEKAIEDPDVFSLSDVRRKTRLGMGTCQGVFCSFRALTLLREKHGKNAPLKSELENFLNHRWKGIRPVLWGAQLQETELARGIYSGLLHLKDLSKTGGE